MKLRRWFITLALAVAAVVVGDRLLTRLASPLEPLGGEPGVVRIRGMDVRYTAYGPEDGPTVLLVHDLYLGASSAEWHRFARALADPYRVVAVDLPGFGRSDRPRVTYDPGLFVTAIEAVIEEATEEPIVLTSGLSATFALDAARTADVDRLVGIAPRERRWPPAPVLGTLISWPIIGTAAYDILTRRGSLRSHLAAHLAVDPAELPGSLVDTAWRSAHQAGSRGGVAAWLAGDLDATVVLADAVEQADLPVEVVVGDGGSHPSVEEARSLAEAVGVPLHVVDGAGGAPHVVAPEVLADHLAREAFA